MQRVAIMGGQDWTDASVDFVNLPDDADINVLHKEYLAFREQQTSAASDWMKRYPNWRNERPEEPYPGYLSFQQWLLETGKGTESDVIQHWED